MNVCDEAFSNIRVENVPSFRYASYAVISKEPEDDAIHRVTEMASLLRIEKPQIIGWDFPKVTQEQMNVYHMHGYEAAVILPEEFEQRTARRCYTMF